MLHDRKKKIWENTYDCPTTCVTAHCHLHMPRKLVRLSIMTSVKNVTTVRYSTCSLCCSGSELMANDDEKKENIMCHFTYYYLISIIWQRQSERQGRWNKYQLNFTYGLAYILLSRKQCFWEYKYTKSQLANVFPFLKKPLLACMIWVQLLDFFKCIYNQQSWSS